MGKSHFILRRAAMTFAIALTAFTVSGFAAPTTAEAAYVSADLNIRYGPSTDYRSFNVIPYGRYVEVLHCLPHRDWCEVEYRGYTGWVSSRYLFQSNHYRGHHYGHSSINVPIFDFWFHISDYDYDRRHRYHNRRHDNHWYERQRHRNRGNHYYRYDRRGHAYNDHHRGRHDNHDRRDRDDRRDRHDRSDRHDRHDRNDRYDRDDRHDRHDRHGRNGRRGR